MFSAHGSETANRLAYFDEDGDTFDFEKTAVSVLVQVRLLRFRKMCLVCRVHFKI